MKKTIKIIPFLLVALLFSSCASTLLKEIGKDMLKEATGIKTYENMSDIEKTKMAIDAGKNLEQKLDSIEKEFTPDEEYYIGRSVAGSIIKTYPVLKNAESENYVNKVLSTLVINNDVPALYAGYHAIILDSEELNAFATPGGHILVTKALITVAGNEEALAAVLAHELSHIALKHGTNSILANRGWTAISEWAGEELTVLNEKLAEEESRNGSDSQAMIELREKIRATSLSNFNEVTNMLGDTIIQKGYSQANEFEADENALSLMANAGYNVEGMTNMLQILINNTPSDATGMFKTHPKPELRLKRINKKIKNYSSNKTDKNRTARYKTAIESL